MHRGGMEIRDPSFHGKGKGLFDRMEVTDNVNLLSWDLKYISPDVEAKGLVPNHKACQVKFINQNATRGGIPWND